MVLTGNGIGVGDVTVTQQVWLFGLSAVGNLTPLKMV